jgi:autotransporter-associated beta strand protein
VQGNATITDGAWHMVTYVADAGTKQIYVDGAAVALTQSAFDNADVSNFVRLGYNTDTLSSLDGNAHLQGDLDEMKFFNVSLTAQQIQQLYSANAIANSSQQYLPTNASVSLSGATAVFDLNNNDQTIGALTGVSGSVVNLGAGVLTTGGNGTSDTFAGNIIGVGGFIKTGAGSTTLNGTNTYTSSTTVAAGTLRLSGNARVPVETGPGGAILNGGTLILDYSGGTNPHNQVVTALQTGNTTAFQTGRYRTTLAMDTTKAIGWLDDGISLFRLRYTFRGDLDLSGVVDSVDFNNFVTGYGITSNASWKNGDVNYDGKVDTQDFNHLAGNFGQPSLGSPNLGSVIPEPASLGLLGLLPILALRRRP